MASEWAAKDQNNVNSLIAVSSANDSTILKLYADPNTHRLLVSSTTVTSGFQQPTGTVNGSNQIFTFGLAPNVISVDQVPKQKVSSDGTVNWTGTTVVTLAIAPNFDIYGIA